MTNTEKIDLAIEILRKSRKGEISLLEIVETIFCFEGEDDS